jgi:nucleotidyltransferase/DNA polymerase involved in DNA repair
MFGDRHSTAFGSSADFDRTGRRRLWERLNPRHRKDLRALAEALVLQQSHGRLQEPLRFRLNAALADLERIAEKISAILAEVARRTPPSQ